MRILKTYLVALFVVFLHFAGQIRYLTSEKNRINLLWHWHNAVALVLDLFLLALLFTVLAVAARRLSRMRDSSWLRRVAGHLFLAALLSGILAAVPSFTHRFHPAIARVAWLAGLAAMGYSLGRARSKLVQYAFNACLVFSPVAFIVSVQIISWPRWRDPPRTEFAVRPATAPKTPVFVFVFDEWSRPRSLVNGRFRLMFKNLRRLCKRAVLFPHSFSPGEETYLSLPRLLFQTDMDLVRRGGRFYWKVQGKKVPTEELPSLFHLSRQHGYNTYLAGWLLPYRRFLGDQVDYCHVYRLFPQGDGVVEEMGYCILRCTPFWTDPVSQRLWPPIAAKVTAEDRFRLSAAFREEMLALLKSCPTNSFLLFQVLLPHYPFIWNPDGTYRGADMASTAEGYDRNLEYLDFYIGQVLETLEGAGKLDDALLVITSDHNWRFEPEPDLRADADWGRRVPLIIKLPRQRAGRVLDGRIQTNHLKPLFEAVFAGERDTPRLLQLLQRLATPP